MPRHNLTRGQTATVSVEQGDIIQIKSGSIELKNNANASDPACFVIRGNASSISFSNTKTILVTCESKSAIFDLVKGL